jgi:hypothetical protein
MNPRRFVAGLVLAALVAVSPIAARPVAARGPYLLVSLASLGTVTWRCNPAREPSLALGFRAFKSSADSYVRLHARRRTYANRHVIPDQAVSFPFIAPQRQQLDISQGTEAGELRAYITVDFAAPSAESHCWSYAPPLVTVRMLPRR